MKNMTWDRVLLGIAALFVIIAGVRYAVNIVLPVLLALFITLILGIPVRRLVAGGMRRWLAMAIVLSVAGVGLMAVALLVADSARQFIALVPHYEEHFRALMSQAVDRLASFGIPVSKETVMGAADPGAAVRAFGEAVKRFGGVMSNLLLILLTLVFMIIEAGMAETKLRAIVSDFEESFLPVFERFMDVLRGYLWVQSTDAAMLGVLFASWLSFLDVHFALLWGLLAFLMNFIPAIGPALAITPPVLLALVDQGWGTFGLAAGGLALCTVIIGNVVEPRRMGEKLGLSPLVVFLSLGFWGWVLGPVGMFMSVPLTMTLKLGLESSETTRWLALMLSSEAEVKTIVDGGEAESAQV